ncbi:MAG: aminoacyl-tRNA hydrolase [Planctomycetes bacterium]|nr:aminoacyl-tRNA hydrolase [Planctomycetota bacterium]
MNKLVVGLGNPGRRYADTRHNVGFRVLDELERRAIRGGSGGITGERRTRFEAEQRDLEIDGCRVLLVWPQTFMNLSGGSVQATRDFFKLANTDVLVVCDDMSLPLGRMRFRSGGSSGGQKGLADILMRLGTEQIPRLRLGIGPSQPQQAVDYVLGRFTADERPRMEKMVSRAADAVGDWVKFGIEKCMNRYNGTDASTEDGTADGR